MGGKVKAPKITGNIQLANGTYENSNTGTILKDIQVSIKGEGQKLVLEKALATDGEKGNLSAHGWLEILSAGDFSSHMDLNLHDTMLFRRYDRTAKTNGHLVFSGSNKKADLSGNIIVGPAELTIPDRLPPEITEIEVIEINRPEGEELSITEPNQGLPLLKILTWTLKSTSRDVFLSEAVALILNGKGRSGLWGMPKILPSQGCYQSFVVISFFLAKDSP